MADVVDHLKYYQAIQTLYLWQTRTMERTRLAELRRLEGTSKRYFRVYGCSLRMHLEGYYSGEKDHESYSESTT